MRTAILVVAALAFTACSRGGEYESSGSLDTAKDSTVRISIPDIDVGMRTDTLSVPTIDMRKDTIIMGRKSVEVKRPTVDVNKKP